MWFSWRNSNNIPLLTLLQFLGQRLVNTSDDGGGDGNDGDDCDDAIPPNSGSFSLFLFFIGRATNLLEKISSRK